MRPIVSILLSLVVLLTSDPAHGYAVRVHEALSRETLPDSSWLIKQPVGPVPGIKEMSGFRRWLHAQIAELPEQALRDRFLKRYPDAASFSSMKLREFLGFNQSPRRRLFGIDRRGKGGSAREVVAFASGAPDRDGRNRDRVAYDDKGQPAKDGSGNTIPDDPSILNMGNALGLSSQAHAHYGLAALEFSDDPDVLQSEPQRFAVAAGFPEGPILSLAADMAQLHTDLALLAQLWGGRGHRWLTVAFIGHGLHYLQDVGNQIHTVQVGLYDFFVDAKLQYWWRAFITSGGTLAPLKAFTSVGIDILRNHHILIEQLTSNRFFDGTLQPELKADDPDFALILDATLEGTGSDFAERIVRGLIETSAPEGGEAYGLARDLGCGRLRSYNYSLPDDTDKVKIDYEQLVCDASRVPPLMDLQRVALGRVATAMRRFDKELAIVAARPDTAALTQEILTRFVAARLDLLDAAEARRAAWKAAPRVSSATTISWGWPIGQALLILLVVLGIKRMVGRDTQEPSA